MARPKVFATRVLPKEAEEMLREAADLEVWPDYFRPPKEVLLEKARDCAGFLTTIEDPMDVEVMEAGRGVLRVVANFAVGYNNIDVAAASRLGIAVSNTPNVLEKTTADLAFALIMATARRVVDGDRDVRLGRWSNWHPLGYVGRDIHGATLAIIGLGQIGLEVAKRGLGFDMKVTYHSRTRKPVEEARHGLRWRPDLAAALREADFVSIHTPLTPETRHLMGRKELASMKPTAILVNTSRGPVVDCEALYEAVRDGVIWGAGLDVTEPEPLPPGHPLLTLPNVVVTPHVGSASIQTRTAMAALAARNILACLRGEPMPSCVNGEAAGKPAP
ncbi:MAG: D-glycerate dehydrogenase [Chloroflexi bacterium]|nr:D-glycerate dehydrogenase [Chloroflexota bacterium]